MNSILNEGLIATTIATTQVVAPVTHAEPIVQNVPQLTPVPHCRNIIEAGTPSNNLVNQIAGGLIGSMIGKDDSTRRLMTGVGVMVGNHLGNKSNKVVHRTHCATSWSNKVVQKTVGYKVSYLLDGQTYTTTMAYNPGHSVTVQRDITVDGPVLNNAVPNQQIVPNTPIPIDPPNVQQHPYLD